MAEQFMSSTRESLTGLHAKAIAIWADRYNVVVIHADRDTMTYAYRIGELIPWPPQFNRRHFCDVKQFQEYNLIQLRKEDQ